MQNFLKKFEDFCKTPGIESGKSRSYANAIAYLCDYLKISVLDTKSISHIKSIQNTHRFGGCSFFEEQKSIGFCGIFCKAKK